MNKKRNVLQIFASRSWGGGEQYVFDLSNKLIDNQYHVSWISSKSDIIARNLQNSQGSYYTLPLKGVYDLYSAFQTARILQNKDIDIIHVHQFKDAFTAVFARLISRKKGKIILTRHLVKKGKSNPLYNWLYKQIDAFIFVSELSRNEFLSTNPKVDRNKIFVIHNSIVIPSLTADTENLRSKHAIKNSTPIIAFLGRLAHEKGLDTLIEALGNLAQMDFALIFIGTGDNNYLKHLEGLAEQNNIANKLFFHGHVAQPYSLIQQVDIGVIPSVVRESFGLSIIELMNAGKPVITTNNGAQKEYIKNNVNGILVTPSDPIGLGQAIKELLANPQKREQLGSNAKETVKKQFSYAHFYNQIINVYEK